jgi:hypothetical protein
MTDLKDGNYPFFVVYDVDRSVVADPEAMSGTTLQSLAPSRSRVVAESEHGSDYPLPILS